MHTADILIGLHSKAPRGIKPSIAANILYFNTLTQARSRENFEATITRKWPIKDLVAAVSWHFTGKLIRD